MATPLTNDSNGRAKSGKFLPGHSFSKGNPRNVKAMQFRAKLHATVTAEDIEEVVKELIRKAKGGDMVAIHELLDRCMGKAVTPIELSDGDAERQFEEMTDDELLRIASGRAPTEGGE